MRRGNYSESWLHSLVKGDGSITIRGKLGSVRVVGDGHLI